MKKFIKGLSYATCILLALVLCAGCSKKKEPTFETKQYLVTGVNTEGFEAGDILAVGKNGQLIKADAKDIDNVVGMVVGRDSVNTFSFSKWRGKAN